MKKNIKRILSLVLCFCMMLSMVSLVSCGDEEPEETEATEPENNNKGGVVTAIRALEATAGGVRLQRKFLQEVQVTTDDLPEGTITDIKKAIGKYLLADVVAGEYITESKLSDKSPHSTNGGAIELKNEDYIVVTDHIAVGGDVSSGVQNLIDSNPNRTLYFPDGTYKFSKPVVTPSDPAKTVSFRLSNYAVFQANSEYKAGNDDYGLVRIGAGAKTKGDANAAGGSSYFMGGVIDMEDKKGAAISVEGGANVLITNVSIRESQTGIYLASDNADVDNCVVVGLGQGATGVKVAGTGCTVSNMRLVEISVGIHMTETGSGNILRNLHPLGSSLAGDPNTKGFYDESAGNQYDYCYSDQFSYCFYLGQGNVSQFNACFGYWWKASAKHYGFYQEGAFNSVILNTRIDNCNASEADNAYIIAGSGNGIIYNPSGGGMDYTADYNRFKK